MSPCKKFSRSIDDYVDGELSRSEKQDVEIHIRACLDCAGHVASLQKLRSKLRKLPAVETTESFHLLLRERIRREMIQQQRKTSFQFTLTHRWMPATGLSLLIIAGGFIVFGKNINLFNNGTPRPIAIDSNARQALPNRAYENKNVRYVLDEYGESVSLDRKDTPELRRSTLQDSANNPRRSVYPRTRAAHVSF